MKATLTTEELVRRLCGLVTKDQLKRWRVFGLFPGQLCLVTYPGGGGSTTLWVNSCVERARLIAETLADGDPTLLRAGQTLFGKGFEVRADLVRQFLIEIPENIERELLKQRRYLKQKGLTDDDKADKLRRYLHNRLNGTAADIIAVNMAIGLGLAGLGNAQQNQRARRIAEYLAPQSIFSAIQKTTDEELIKLYAGCSKFEGIAAHSHVLFSLLSSFQIGDAFDYFGPLFGRADDDAMALFESKRSTLLWCVLLSVNGTHIYQDIAQLMNDSIIQIVTANAAMPVDYSDAD